MVDHGVVGYCGSLVTIYNTTQLQKTIDIITLVKI